jgi:sulfur carrier protein
MLLIVNGEPTEAAAKTLDDLLRELDYEGRHYAIAVNFAVVPRARWAATPLQSGDEIEILAPRQGG